MLIPSKIRTYCPFCNKHTVHAVKLYKKGKSRTLAIGNRRHRRKLRGYIGKVAGEKPVKKQGKRIKLLLTCEKCGKKHERVLWKRMKRKPEIKR